MSQKRPTRAGVFNAPFNGDSNGTMRKVAMTGQIVSLWGVPLMLVVFVGWASGYIPSPLTTIVGQIRDHDLRVSRLVEERTASETRLTDALRTVAVELQRSEQRRRFLDCAVIKDLELRRECLK